MLVPFLALVMTAALVSASSSPQAAVVSLEGPDVAQVTVRPPVIVAAAADRMIPPSTPEGQIHELAVRVSSPAGVLWQGNLRVAQNQSASYSQNLSQASPLVCPNPSPYDRSERSSVSFNVYVQNNGEYGPVYRLDASWQRPTEETGCGERGTRTVQVSKALALNAGDSGLVEGDAGLKVEVTRRR